MADQNEGGDDGKWRGEWYARDQKEARLKAAHWFAQLPARIAEAKGKGLSDADIRKPPFDTDLANINLSRIMGDVFIASSLGGRVKAIRKHYSLTQAELADVLKVKQASVSRWEKNKAEPGEEVVAVLGFMADMSPADIRYGPQEPTSTGHLVPERPVLLVGMLRPDGWIDAVAKRHQYITLMRPREGRPHEDVVGVLLDDESAFSFFQGENWVFFYRSELHEPPGDHLGEVCVVRYSDLARERAYPNLRLARILEKHTATDGLMEHYSVMLANGGVAKALLEWASPVLAFRQVFGPIEPHYDES